MSGRKTFNNNSKNYINVTFLVRQRNDIQKPSLEEKFSLNPRK